MSSHEISPPGDGSLVISPLLPTVEAAEEFLQVERGAYRAAYKGMPCKDTDGLLRPIASQDMAGLFDASSASSLADMARQGFAPHTDSTLLLVGCISTEENFAGVLNMKFGELARWRTEANGRPNDVEVKLHEIDVLPKYMRHGIGRALLRTALGMIADDYSPEAMFGLEVATHNEVAKAWYTRLGVTPTGRSRTTTWPSEIQIELEEWVAPLGLVRARLGNPYSSAKNQRLNLRVATGGHEVHEPGGEK